MYPMAAIVPWHTVPALCDAVESIEEFVAERDTIISCLRLYGSPSYHAAEFAAVMFYPALSSRQARQSLQSTITSTELLSLAKHPQSGQPGATAPPTSLLSPQQKKPAITDVVRGSKVAIAIGATPISIGRCVLLCNVLPCFVQLGSVWCRCRAVCSVCCHASCSVCCHCRAIGQRVLLLLWTGAPSSGRLVLGWYGGEQRKALMTALPTAASEHAHMYPCVSGCVFCIAAAARPSRSIS